MDQQIVGATGQGELIKRRRSEIPDAERVLTLQEKLYQKAKQERDFKFYVLYDKMFIKYILREAWKTVKANGGAPGVDKVTIAEVEIYGVDKYLEELGEELRKQTYEPQAVKRVMIPKANGGERPLGIPTVRDRIAQTACKMILEPIYEADFAESSYGFRPNRSSKDAMTAIKGHLKEGMAEVYDADLSKYFDTIPHDKLLLTLKERIADPRILKLITKWLKVPVYEDGQYKSGKKNRTGTPQGGVISPLLANVYMHLIDRNVNRKGSLFDKYGVKIVRYADDFVLMGRTLPQEIVKKLTTMLNRMGLSLNETKTRQIDARETGFDFLGFTVRYDRDFKGRKTKYWNIMPSKKSEVKIRDKVSDFLKTHGHFKAQDVADGLNTIMRGWLNYFEIKGVSYPAMSKRRLRHYLCDKLYQYYNRKSQRKCRLYGQNAFEALTIKYGLIDPTKYAKLSSSLVNANDEFYRKAVCGKTARTV
jgi:group II intron reverse transcriptase/maturase